MDQFSIHIHANNSPTSVEFVEKNYKLNAGETLIGKDNDFPEKKNIAPVTTWFEDWQVLQGELTGITPTASVSLRTIDLTSFLTTYFNTQSGEERPDKGLTFEADLFFFMNHVYEIEGSPPTIHHFSLTANLLIRFTLMKTNTSVFYLGNMTVINASGKWVKYDYTVNEGKVEFYTGILSNGNAIPQIGTPGETPNATQCFAVVHDALTTSTLKFTVSNILRDNTGFSSLPNYDAKVRYKIRALNYDQSDHTYEYVR